MENKMMYRTRYDDIKCFQVVKETPKQVVSLHDGFHGLDNGKMRECREHKRSYSQAWFDTFEEAQQFLIEKYDNQIAFHSRGIDRCTSAIDMVNEMKDPAVEVLTAYENPTKSKEIG